MCMYRKSFANGFGESPLKILFDKYVYVKFVWLKCYYVTNGTTNKMVLSNTIAKGIGKLSKK